jgi:hypothetical protein
MRMTAYLTSYVHTCIYPLCAHHCAHHPSLTNCLPLPLPCPPPPRPLYSLSPSLYSFLSLPCVCFCMFGSALPLSLVSPVSRVRARYARCVWLPVYLSLSVCLCRSSSAFSPSARILSTNWVGIARSLREMLRKHLLYNTRALNATGMS